MQSPGCGHPALAWASSPFAVILVSAYIPVDLRSQIEPVDRERCCYCLTQTLTGETVPLFNPRQQCWAEHFAWSEDGTRVEGLTLVGRVTGLALQMNHAMIVVARRRWVSSGWHPPFD